jgi:hypothetical protein
MKETLSVSALTEHLHARRVWGLGFGVWGLWFVVWGLGFGVEELGFENTKLEWLFD